VAKGPRTVLTLPDGTPEPLTGGYKNDVVRHGDVVVRVERTTLASARWEHGLLRRLAADLSEVVAPLAGPERRPDGRIASVFPYVEGRALDRDAPAERSALAELLARLHRAGLAWRGGPRREVPAFTERDPVTNAWWDWRIVDKPSPVRAAYDELVGFLSDPPPLARGVVHGDVYRGNVLVREGRIAGLVDWEYARVDWPAWELANATWEVCKVGDSLDAARAREFVAAYVDAGGPAETEPLEQLVRGRLVVDLLYSLTSKARGEPFDPSYADHLLRALA